MERASVLLAERDPETAVRPAGTRRRSAVRRRQALFAMATVVASLAVSTPAFAWPMCGC